MLRLIAAPRRCCWPPARRRSRHHADNEAAPAATDRADPDHARRGRLHSFAKPLEARVTHVALDLAVDFAAKRVGGTATLDIDARPDASEIILDDKGLEIEKIADADGKPLPYKVGASRAEHLGAPLDDRDRPAAQDRHPLQVGARSGRAAMADARADRGQEAALSVQPGRIDREPQLDPDPGFARHPPDAGKPGSPFPAADRGHERAQGRRAGRPTGRSRQFAFRMDKPVAPYLIAIAVGDLAFRALGPRTGVWTEPAMLDKAAAELADTEKMVERGRGAVRSLSLGPLRHARPAAVLPLRRDGESDADLPHPDLHRRRQEPGQPDRARTCAQLVGQPRHQRDLGRLLAQRGHDHLCRRPASSRRSTAPRSPAQQVALGHRRDDEAVAENGGPTGADTRLHLDLKGRHPDDGLSDIAYEKGAAFLRTIEAAVGRERFDAWLKGWFDRHAFQPVTTAMFLADIRQHLVKGDQALEAKLTLDDWVDQPGIPANLVPADPAAFAEVDRGGHGVLPAAPRRSTRRGIAGPPTSGCASSTALPRKQPADRLDVARPRLRPHRAGNNEVALRLARSGGRQSASTRRSRRSRNS